MDMGRCGGFASSIFNLRGMSKSPNCLDGYIGAMSKWIQAAEKGESVTDLIPVNIVANKENAEKLKVRLNFLDEKILSKYKNNLKSN